MDALYRRCAERIEGILPEWNARDRTLVTRAFEHYVSRIDWFAAFPKRLSTASFWKEHHAARGARQFGERFLRQVDRRAEAGDVAGLFSRIPNSHPCFAKLRRLLGRTPGMGGFPDGMRRRLNGSVGGAIEVSPIKKLERVMKDHPKDDS